MWDLDFHTGETTTPKLNIFSSLGPCRKVYVRDLLGAFFALSGGKKARKLKECSSFGLPQKVYVHDFLGALFATKRILNHTIII